jgi:hypothetical protein
MTGYLSTPVRTQSARTSGTQPPTCASAPTAAIEQRTYTVTYTGLGTRHSVINYDKNTPVTSVVDLGLEPFITDAEARGQGADQYVPSGGYLCSVSAGFEIWNGDGEQTTSFSYQPTSSTAETAHMGMFP